LGGCTVSLITSNAVSAVRAAAEQLGATVYVSHAVTAGAIAH
jgi:galactokinase